MEFQRKQKQIWYQEHLTSATLPTVASGEPSDSIIFFVEYLKTECINPPQKVVDIGCGKGRNSFYLAQQGFHLYALDYIKEAIEFAQVQAKIRNLEDKIDFLLADIDAPWNFADNFFDLAIDCFSSIDIETEVGRDICKKELLRTLKPGGYALVAVVAAHDELEAELMKHNPGHEKNSALWPQNGKFQKNYDRQELQDFYKEFEIVQLQERVKPAFKLGTSFTSTNFWLLLRKSQ